MFITSQEEYDFRPKWGGKVQLQGKLVYRDVEYGEIIVDDGFIFDLASYGRVSNGIFDKLGQSMRPATIHDWLYRTQPKPIDRMGADRIYRDTLIIEGASKVSAWSQWAGVRAGGWFAWNKHKRVLAADEQKKISSE